MRGREQVASGSLVDPGGGSLVDRGGRALVDRGGRACVLVDRGGRAFILVDRGGRALNPIFFAPALVRASFLVKISKATETFSEFQTLKISGIK